MELTFKEDTHQYFIGDKELISVTQLMQKHGLSPSYSDAPAEVLRAKGERGTLIHKEIEDYLLYGKIGFTKELQEFINWINANDVKVIAVEKRVHNGNVAGTLDIKLEINGKKYLGDHKTTASYHGDSVSWQLSIYDKLDGDDVDGYLCFWFSPNGLLVKVVDKKPVVEIDRLLECERKGEIYQAPPVTPDTQLMQLVEVETLIKSIEEQKKQAEEQAKELRAALMEAMEQKGVKSFENERIRITYVAPSTRQTLDSTKLKKEQPAIYEQYSKPSETKASLRITLKEAKNNE